MHTNALPSERWVIAGQVDPGAKSATEHLSAAIDMSRYHSLVAISLAGILGSSATSTLALKSANASGGSYDAITGKTTALAKATDDDKQAIINLRADQLDAADDRYVKASLTVATNTSDVGALILGEKRSGPEVANALGSERLAVLGVIDPDVYAAGAAVGDDWVDLGKWGAVMAALVCGTLGTAVSVAVTFEQATSSGGAGAKALSGKTLAGAATSDSSAISIRGDDLDEAGGFRYVRATLTVTDATSPETATAAAAVVILGVDHQDGGGKASDFDLASVKSIVN